MDLQDLRKEIDRIDDELVRLFCQRMDIAAKIADYKKEHNLPVFVPAREQEKLEDVARKAGPELAEDTKALYETLFSLSRGYQNRRLSQSHSDLTCGLLGRKLNHSYSPAIHRFLGSYSYNLFEKEPDALELFLKSRDFSGINVTIPYKKEVIRFLDDLSPIARKLGAVNTIVRRADGTLWGHNTDYEGFAAMLTHSGLDVNGKKVLVLGSGGASCTVVSVLEAFGALPVVISRSGENHYGNLSRHTDAAVIVNTTPVGMFQSSGILKQNSFPHVEQTPVDLSVFPNLCGVMDLVYNPARTQLLRDAEDRGIPCWNGLWMLIAQAKAAAECFTGRPIPDSVVPEIFATLFLQMQNIILIGMPGCGKTTIGKLLAEKMGRSFVDTDGFVSFLADKSIPDIIRENGISDFRARETDVLRTSASQSGKVIVTGGGSVTEERNYPLMHQNGIIIWLKRDLEKLATEGRPLSQTGSLQEMYTIREPMYLRFADHSIDNNGSPEQTVNAILTLLEDLS